MIALVDLATAQAHLRDDDPANAADIQNKIYQASAIVLSHLKIDAIPDEWQASSSPVGPGMIHKIEAAKLLVLGELYENREASISKPLSEGVMNLLIGLRDPALA